MDAENTSASNFQIAVKVLSHRYLINYRCKGRQGEKERKSGSLRFTVNGIDEDRSIERGISRYL